MDTQLPRIVLLALFILAVRPAMAWNKAGHMVTAAIAYQELLKAGQTNVIAKVVDRLSQMPDFDQRWRSKLTTVSSEDRDQYMFMLAARWPDDVRGTSEHREKWHYINFPFKPPGVPASVTTLNPDPENILVAFRTNRALMKQGSSAGARAKALCWVFHLTGDMHQPLHSSALFNKQFPKGDRGGTRFYVRITEESSTHHLHSVWDDLVQGSDRFTSVRNRATVLRSVPAHSRSNLAGILAEKTYTKWAEKESFSIAVNFGYRNGTLAGSTDEEDGELLPPGFSKPNKKVNTAKKHFRIHRFGVKMARKSGQFRLLYAVTRCCRVESEGSLTLYYEYEDSSPGRDLPQRFQTPLPSSLT